MEQSSKKRLLALDGGGLMGLISLGILQQIEDQLRIVHGGQDDFRLRDFFDYIAGTSTGAIIAAGLMTGMRVSELQDLYTKLGSKMFTPASPFKVIPWIFSSRQYHHEPLAELLRKTLGTGTIAELQEAGTLPTEKHLMMVMHNVNTDSPWCVSTNPASYYNQQAHKQCNLNLPLWLLVRASTAAPGYFSPQVVEMEPGNSGSCRVFQDGGLTPHNNPALKLFQMATLPEYRLEWSSGVDRMLLVSVGTGRVENLSDTIDANGTGIWRTAGAAPGWLMAGASAENDLMCRMLGECRFGPKIDNEVGCVTSNRRYGKLFSYVRYDTLLTEDSLKQAGTTLGLSSMKMDKVEAIPDFVRIGTTVAAQVDCPTQLTGFL